MRLSIRDKRGVIVPDPVDRSVLPLRRRAFGGVANRTLAGSQPDWNILSSPKAPEGAPNVLVVLMDDAGFGQPDTFGGAVSTPALSRLADDGLRYNRFTSRRCARRRVPRC
jgi:Sulfatase